MKTTEDDLEWSYSTDYDEQLGIEAELLPEGHPVNKVEPIPEATPGMEMLLRLQEYDAQLTYVLDRDSEGRSTARAGVELHTKLSKVVDEIIEHKNDPDYQDAKDAMLAILRRLAFEVFHVDPKLLATKFVESVAPLLAEEVDPPHEPRVGQHTDVERAGPWKSGEGDYPFADEVYDLTHTPEPDEGDFYGE